jgi:hypothetical protein
MLEYQRLRILPWTPPTDAPSRRTGAKELLSKRSILELNSDTVLGFICKAPQVGPSWLRWLLLQGQVWEARETEDESLLFTMQERRALTPARKWSHWHVMDAEGSTVGTLDCRNRRELSRGETRTVARDSLGQPAAVLDHWPEGVGVPARVLQLGAPAELSELATVCLHRDSVHLEFASTLEGDPFAKMLVLAAVLAASAAIHH